MIFGFVVTLVGLLGIFLRLPLTALAMRLFSVSGIDMDESRVPKIQRLYLCGGVFMVVAGIVTVVFAL